MAYRLTNDHNAQRKVWRTATITTATLSNGCYGEAYSKLARFVGLPAAYEKAGGKTPAISSAKVKPGRRQALAEARQ